jgi:hypothetical protein
MNYTYIDRNGREVSEREACDGTTLRDGFGLRVKAIMADSAIRAEMDDYFRSERLSDDGAALHRPGFRYSNRQSVRDAQLAVDAAYERYEHELTNAWRGSGTESVGDVPHRKSTDASMDARDAAYAEYDAWVQNAWRTA